MEYIKTAISIQKSLFDQAERLASLADDGAGGS